LGPSLANEMMNAIFPAEMSDCTEILALQKLCYRQEAEIYNDFIIPPLTQCLEEMHQEYASGIFLKALHDHTIVGSVRAYSANGTCFIGRLIVHPAFQNRGIGRRLMEAIENRFSSAARYELFTGEKSAKNIHLYQTMGYAIYKSEKLSN